MLASIALAIGVASCRADCPRLDAAPPSDAGAGVDACICEPHWPGCPPGCTPPDGGAP